MGHFRNSDIVAQLDMMFALSGSFADQVLKTSINVFNDLYS